MGMVEVNDTQLWVDEHGEGPALLLLHGLGSSGLDWERQVPHFAMTHRVVTVDLRGHGRSAKPPGPYSIRQFSDDVAATITALDLAPVSVVGISMGGMTAFQLGADHSDLIDRLVIVNALPDSALAQQAGQVRLRRMMLRVLGLRRLGRMLAGRLFVDPDQEQERTTMVERWATNDKRAYAAAFQAILDWPGVTDRIGAFDHPFLMISADHDYAPLAVKQPYLDALPHLQHVVIDNSHHAVPVERPAQFNAALEDFLRSR